MRPELLSSLFRLTLFLASAGLSQGQEKKPAPFTPPSGAPSPATPGTKPQKLNQMAEADYLPALQKTLEDFSTAKDLDTMLTFVRDRKRTEPLIRAYYTSANPWKPPGYRPASDRHPSPQNNLVVYMLETSDFNSVPVTLFWNGTGFLVDWESYVGYGELRWDELAKKRPVTDVLMRVFIEQQPGDEYFNEDFTDRKAYHCFKLHDRQREVFLFGYTVPGSAADKQILQNLRPTPAGRTGTLSGMLVVKLKFLKEGKSTRQVEITEVIANGWVQGDTDKSASKNDTAKPQ